MTPLEEFLDRLERDDYVGDSMFIVAVICFLAALVAAGCSPG